MRLQLRSISKGKSETITNVLLSNFANEFPVDNVMLLHALHFLHAETHSAKILVDSLGCRVSSNKHLSVSICEVSKAIAI